MTQRLRTVQILRGGGKGRARVIADGEICGPLGPQEFGEIALSWGTARQGITGKLTTAGIPEGRWPEHFHWDWQWKADVLLGAPSRIAFGLRCEQQWQGWLLTVGVQGGFTSHLPPPGRPLLYVDYLEIAPWNLKIDGIDQVPRFTAVGTRLLQHAVQVSLDTGFAGRTGLHSLPQARPFYERCGMTGLGADPAYHGMEYFEFPPESVSEFMRKP